MGEECSRTFQKRASWRHRPAGPPVALLRRWLPAAQTAVGAIRLLPRSRTVTERQACRGRMAGLRRPADDSRFRRGEGWLQRGQWRPAPTVPCWQRQAAGRAVAGEAQGPSPGRAGGCRTIGRCRGPHCPRCQKPIRPWPPGPSAAALATMKPSLLSAPPRTRNRSCAKARSTNSSFEAARAPLKATLRV